MTRAAKKTSPLPVHKDRRTWDTAQRGEAQRPFRLWDAKGRKYMRWRCYSTAQRAHMGALYEARWSPVGTVVEVVDCRTGRLIAQYAHRINGIDYLE